MAISKAERLMDLVLALLHARIPRSAAWIRSHVAGYGDATSDESFGRMFERDKQELRDLGIPIETDTVAEGYRINPGEFALPPLVFTPAESAALAVAARLWDTSALAAAGGAAYRKVLDSSELACGGELESGAFDPTRLQARIRTAEPVFDPLFRAIRARRRVRFDYRGVADQEAATRSVEPWGLVNARGAWYLVGFDLDREATRTFRLTRIVGDVATEGRTGTVTIPSDLDLRALVDATADSSSDDATAALLRIRVGRAAGLRRGGQLVSAAGPGGFDDVSVPMRSVKDLARRVAAAGSDAIAVDPVELREATIALLSGAAASRSGGMNQAGTP